MKIARAVQSPAAISPEDDTIGMFLQRLLRSQSVGGAKPDLTEDPESVLKFMKQIVSMESVYRARRASLITDYSQDYTFFLGSWLQYYRSVLQTPLFFFGYGKPYSSSFKLCFLDLVHDLPSVGFVEYPGVPADLLFYSILESDEMVRREDERFHLYLDYPAIARSENPFMLPSFNKAPVNNFFKSNFILPAIVAYDLKSFYNVTDNSLAFLKQYILNFAYSNSDKSVNTFVRSVFLNRLISLKKLKNSHPCFDIIKYLLHTTLVQDFMVNFCGCHICRLGYLKPLQANFVDGIINLAISSQRLSGCIDLVCYNILNPIHDFHFAPYDFIFSVFNNLPVYGVSYSFFSKRIFLPFDSFNIPCIYINPSMTPTFFWPKGRGSYFLGLYSNFFNNIENSNRRLK